MSHSWDCGGGYVVGELAFNSDDPAQVFGFYSVNCLKKTKINKKSASFASCFFHTVSGK